MKKKKKLIKDHASKKDLMNLLLGREIDDCYEQKKRGKGKI